MTTFRLNPFDHDGGRREIAEDDRAASIFADSVVTGPVIGTPVGLPIAGYDPAPGNDQVVDRDGDGVGDADEHLRDTIRMSPHPRDLDSDGDGSSDAVEIDHGSDPFDPDHTPGSPGDLDGNGYPDVLEALAEMNRLDLALHADPGPMFGGEQRPVADPPMTEPRPNPEPTVEPEPVPVPEPEPVVVDEEPVVVDEPLPEPEPEPEVLPEPEPVDELADEPVDDLVPEG